MLNKQLIERLTEKHPKPENYKFTYGTAGFRLNSTLLDSVMFRVGILAVLRSKALGKTVGSMMTASHNGYQDNGIKICEPLGEMLVPEWEQHAMNLANANDLIESIEEIIRVESIDLSVPATVVVARDTRPSGNHLVQSLIEGIESVGGKVLDFGIQTTPQLHYLVRCLNDYLYGQPTEEGYYQKLSKAFKILVDGNTKLSPLYVDCANGVGSLALQRLQKYLGQEYLQIEIQNADIENPVKLNHDCGADFVKIRQEKPSNFDLKEGYRCASLDGDADRIVFYYFDKSFKLLDGDKIATLAAGFIRQCVTDANISFNGSPITIGLVQTAYANGSSTAYAKDQMQVPVVFTPTGVKHLHHAAEEFDVGVYFEANGHGTVLFSKRAIELFQSVKGTTEKSKKALIRLCALTDLINQTVGDAISDLLLVEAILSCQQLSFEDWDKAYTDLPSKQEKVKVANRHIFVPINADTELSQPLQLQNEINSLVKNYSKARCFVRPSGTEDIVRVYTEASTLESTLELSAIVCGLIFDKYGGVGEKPSHFK